ncbi:hypothetical protein Moror_1799 [Moniliophthora roreri MCA 2997]|uniref:RING-type domain-containing protein n=1 Tax=Moniliophthora roreri (strain MCA 2997) TaxID=1381753 RepID=V2X2P4_MONRO|nr:hypothetical protein Moror_1799 [Moniliophthora roreri MCA 2997]
MVGARLGSSDSFFEQEYSNILNLGIESSDSILEEVINTEYTSDEWIRSGLAVHTNVPARPRTWRSNSFGEKTQRRPVIIDEVEDTDCGICFMNSVSPYRMKCCGKFFCYEHVHDWLNGPASDGRCPECCAPCSLEIDSPISSTSTRPTIITSSPIEVQEEPDTPTTPVNKRANSSPLHIDVSPKNTLKDITLPSPTLSTSSDSSSSGSSATSSTALTSMPSDEESLTKQVPRSRTRAYSDSHKPVPFFREEKVDHAAKLLRLKMLVSYVAAQSCSSPSLSEDGPSQIEVLDSDSDENSEVISEISTPPMIAKDLDVKKLLEPLTKAEAEVLPSPYVYTDDIDSSVQAVGRVLGLVGAMVISGTLLS